MIKNKTEDDFEKFAILLLKSKTYKTVGLRLLNSATTLDISEQNIRKEISELVGRYTRLKRPSDKSFRQLEQALVDHYRGLRKTKLEELEERIFKRENQWSSLTETDVSAKMDEGAFSGAQERLNKYTINLQSLDEDMELRNIYMEDSVKEQKRIGEDRAKLSNIQKLHDKQIKHILNEMDKMHASISKYEVTNQLASEQREKEKKLLVKQVAGQIKKLQEMRKNDNQKINSLSEEIGMLNEHQYEEIMEVKEKNDELKEKLEGLDAEYNNMKKETERLKEENERLMDLNTELVDHTTEEYERKIKTLRVVKKKQKKQNEELEKKIEELLKEKEESKREIEELKAQIRHHLPPI